MMPRSLSVIPFVAKMQASHCQAPVKYKQCKYCVGCFQRRRMLQHRAVHNGQLGLQARAELKVRYSEKEAGRVNSLE
jgi:hypothetical protein